MRAIHMAYAVGDGASERPGQSSRCKDEGDTDRALIAAVPEGQVID
jgi:hypothetical protein